MLLPADCGKCKTPWVHSEVRTFFCMVPEFQPDCVCGVISVENKEYGWRNIRRWNWIVYALRERNSKALVRKMKGLATMPEMMKDGDMQ